MPFSSISRFLGFWGSNNTPSIDAAVSSPSHNDDKPDHQMLEGDVPPTPGPTDKSNNANGTGENDNELENQEEFDYTLSSRYTRHRKGKRSKLPTFSRTHNKALHTDDDFEIWNDLIEDVLVGCVEKTGNNQDAMEQHDAENVDEQNGMEGTEEESEQDQGSEEEDDSEVTNETAVANAIASGVKVHDFAVMPIPGDPREFSYAALIFKIHPTPEVFPAHEKALQFYYMHYLIKNDVFDLPHARFTVDDVDRLFTAKFIQPKHLDNYLLCSMLATGAYKRCMGMNPHDINRDFDRRACWTIPRNDRPPTRKEIRDYIIAQENERYAYRVPTNWYPMDARERPELTNDYVLHRIYVHGFYGLHSIGIDDDEAFRRFVRKKDRNFIPPKHFRAEDWMYHAHDEDRASRNGTAGPDLSGPSARPNSSASPAPAQPDSSASVNCDSPGPSQPDTPELGRSDVSNGKKRSRSPSPDEEPSRRTHARLSEETDSSPTTPDASGSDVAHQSYGIEGISSPSRGKKRVRDDEQEEEILESTPMKKLKTASVSDASFSDPFSVLMSLSTFAASLFQTASNSSSDVEDVDYGRVPGAFLDPKTQSEASQLASPSSFEPDVDMDTEVEDSPMDEADDVWFPHPPAPAPLTRQNAFYVEDGITIPTPNGQYELPSGFN